jgi:hypothetical protein
VEGVNVNIYKSERNGYTVDLKHSFLAASYERV